MPDSVNSSSLRRAPLYNEFAVLLPFKGVESESWYVLFSPCLPSQSLSFCNIHPITLPHQILSKQNAIMVKYPANCHCGHHEWEWDLNEEQSKHILCHCDTCKILSGSTYTLNQM